MTTKSLTERVWIVNQTDQDVSHAKTFGKLEFLSKGRVDSFKIDRLIALVHNGLAESSPTDWIVPAGHVVLSVLTCLEFARRHNRLNLLIWHARDYIYVPRRLEVRLDSDVSESFLQAMIEDSHGI